MKRKVVILFIFTLVLLTICGCQREKKGVDATKHGLSERNSGKENSIALQALIDELSAEGGVIYIPKGEYEFAENGTQTIGSHCIKMRSGVSIVGDGEKTVLKPIGESKYGMDMFYFNDYLDLGEPNYLENCRFEDFVIDATETSCITYTSAGKGFMFNLFKNCHWKGVTVKNTVATGFGVDCPIESSITDCRAIGCGSGATTRSSGASGFGIGYGYSPLESMVISRCEAFGNKKFGIFFEHQGRFNNKMYSAQPLEDFVITNCTSGGNLYDFGGICTAFTSYRNCRSEGAVDSAFYFESSSGVSVIGSFASDSPLAVSLVGTNGSCTVSDCSFTDIADYDVRAEGSIHSLTLTNNSAELGRLLLEGEIAELKNENNSWN